MKKVIIGFSKTDQIFSKAIMCLEDTDFSHVYFNFRSETLDRDIIYHASFFNGVSFINKSRFLEISKIVHEVEIELTDEQHIKLMQYMIDNAGIHYGKLQILGMALVRILKPMGIKIDNPIKDGMDTMVCSEIVGNILIQLGLINKLDLEVEGVKALYDSLKIN